MTMANSPQQRIHFIGICGVAMSALAIAFKKQGWLVTGSDAGFFPPISTELEKHEIKFYPGWHPDKMIASGVPEMVVVGNVASSGNPEWLYVQKQSIPYLSYPELIAKCIVKANSIVCAGTYGKTTTSALLAWILTEAKFDPSYMFGGLCLKNPSPSRGGIGRGYSEANEAIFPSAKLSDSHWSVLEGDEYKSARWDNRPKFSHYSPTRLLLTSILWDHADVYPAEALYFEAFKKLLQMMPKDGAVVACVNDTKIQSLISNFQPARIASRLEAGGFSVIQYGLSKEVDYEYKNVKQNKAGISFEIVHHDNQFHIESPLLGDFQAANITGVFALATSIGIPAEKIIAAIAAFPGLKRRLEKRFAGAITVFDDIAHSPAKARATLATLRQIYTGKIITVFEPNTGNRKLEAINSYTDAFRAADEVIIPRLTKLKKDHKDTVGTLNGEQLAQIIGRTHKNVICIDSDTELVAHLKKSGGANSVIVFLGSHGFRGMIEALLTQL